MHSELEKIKKMEVFIQQFDSLTPTNGKEVLIKNMAEEYKECIERIKKYDAKLVDILKLGDFDIEKLTKQEEYPAAIRAYHLIVSTIVGGGILALVVIGVGTTLGGTNPDTWSPITNGISYGGGSLPAVPVAAILVRNQKKNFINNPEKRSFIEKAIVKKVNKTRAAKAAIALNINENRANIISNNPIFTKEVITKNNKIKTVFTDEINDLPLITKNKIKSLYKKIQKEFKESDKLRIGLESQVKSIINSNPDKPIISKAYTDRPIIIQEQKFSKEEQFQKILLETFKNKFPDLEEDSIKRKTDPLIEKFSVKGELKNMSDEDMERTAQTLVNNTIRQIEAKKEKPKKKRTTAEPKIVASEQKAENETVIENQNEIKSLIIDPNNTQKTTKKVEIYDGNGNTINNKAR